MQPLPLGLTGPTPNDPRQYSLLGQLAKANLPVDFSAGSGLMEPADEDQGTSGSCTVQAFCSYFWQWTGIDLSRHDGYWRVRDPQQGGAFIPDPFYLYQKKDYYRRDQLADPSPQTEENMSSSVVLELQRDTLQRFLIRFWNVTDMTMDGIAYAIKHYKGCVGGIEVNWNSWPSYEFPEPRDPAVDPTSDGNHALYFYDFGFIQNGHRGLKAKSSWCNTVKNHWIKENYLHFPQAFGFVVMEVEEITNMPENGFIEILNNKGKVGIVQYVDTTENLIYQGRLHGFPVPVLKNADGTPQIGPDGHVKLDWSKIKIGITI